MSDLSQGLSLPALDYLFEKIKAIPYSRYDEPTITLVRGFTIGAINANLQVSTIHSFPLYQTKGFVSYTYKYIYAYPPYIPILSYPASSSDQGEEVVRARDLLGFVAR